MTEEQHMQAAVDIAGKGLGFVNPNPLVGAIIVKDDEVIGIGYHEKYGGLHAERNALAQCNTTPQGATLYVTLEPCCHYGKTPPCTDAIIESGIRKVVVGCKDPNPLVSGKGITKLREHGIDVIHGVLEKECQKLNEVFFHYIETGLPYVVMKYAMTMDGKIAAHTGKSKWITGEAARQEVHRDRLRYTAVMVGVGTIFADDPLLTCRISEGRNPVRIVCDTNLNTPLQSQIIATAKDVRTIIATVCTDEKKIKPYIEKQCEIITVKTKDSSLASLSVLPYALKREAKRTTGIDLRELMSMLGDAKIDSILLEGGGTLNWSALQSGIVNKVQTYIAPKILGGLFAPSPVGGLGADDPACAFFLKNSVVRIIDEDILIESEVVKKCSPE